jgi:hypothetical protein
MPLSRQNTDTGRPLAFWSSINRRHRPSASRLPNLPETLSAADEELFSLMPPS